MQQQNQTLNSFWSTALSITSTIGSIAGKLLGLSNSTDGEFPIVTYNLGGANTQPAVFDKDINGNIILKNPNTDENTAIGISFPKRNGLQAESVIIPGMTKLNVSPLFKNFAEHDVSDFQLTSGNSSHLSIENNKNPHINISASGTQLKVSSKNENDELTLSNKIRLGSFLEIELSPTGANIFATGGLAIVGIIVMNVHDSGDTLVRILNACQSYIRNAASGDSEVGIHVDFPNSLSSNALVDIDIQVECESVTSNFRSVVNSSFAKNITSMSKDEQEIICKRLENKKI